MRFTIGCGLQFTAARQFAQDVIFEILKAIEARRPARAHHGRIARLQTRRHLAQALLRHQAEVAQQPTRHLRLAGAHVGETGLQGVADGHATRLYECVAFTTIK